MIWEISALVLLFEKMYCNQQKVEPITEPFVLKDSKYNPSICTKHFEKHLYIDK